MWGWGWGAGVGSGGGVWWGLGGRGGMTGLGVEVVGWGRVGRGTTGDD